MPRAKAGYVAGGDTRVPRTLFQHAHQHDDAGFPCPLDIGCQTGLTFMLMPDNLNGFDACNLWFLGGSTEALTVNVTVDIGTHNEAANTHTQTVNGIAVNTVNGEYERIPLTVTHAVVFGNLASRDMVRITVVLASGDGVLYLVGSEIQES